MHVISHYTVMLALQNIITTLLLFFNTPTSMMNTVLILTESL